MDVIDKLNRWRHLIEPETSRGLTAVPWSAVPARAGKVFEGAHSVVVTHDVRIASGMARSIWVAVGVLDEVMQLVDEVEDSARRDGMAAVIFMGRKGWLRAARGYRSECVVGVKEL